jgi:hypothetical protein
MGDWLRIGLVVAHLGALALPCPSPAVAGPAGERGTELHALCHCGCEEAPPATRSASLAAALLPASLLPELPRAAHLETAPAPATSADAGTPEPVPRAA